MPIPKPEIEDLIEKNEEHYCGDEQADTCLKIIAVANLPTKHGEFQVVGFYNNGDHKEHIALVKGDVCCKEDVPVRLHSECLTGDAIGSLRCDCGDQLATAMEKVHEMECGMILYLRQEGRGIGLLNKMKAYQLQDFGYDTVQANEMLGFKDDERDYAIAAHMIRSLEVKSIKLMTNNPRKVENLKRHGIEVSGRIPVMIPPNVHNEKYLQTKMRKSGHMLDDLFV